jgi:hypothetical protein
LGNINKKNNAGATPYDVVMLFKILILQRYYGLGDSQVEYQILDRSSFKIQIKWRMNYIGIWIACNFLPRCTSLTCVNTKTLEIVIELQ